MVRHGNVAAMETATRRPPIGLMLVALLFAVAAGSALMQVVMAATGGSDDPAPLVALQLVSGLFAAAAAVGAWRRARWSSIACVGYGITTAVMLALLPHLLGLEAEARRGIFSGAAVVLLFSVAAAWYVHRYHAGAAGQSPN